MAYRTFDHIPDYESSEGKPDYRKDKVKGVVVIVDEPSFQQMLNEVGEVLDHHCTYPCRKSNKGAQQHDELLLSHVLGPPDEEP